MFLNAVEGTRVRLAKGAAVVMWSWLDEFSALGLGMRASVGCPA